MNEEAGLVMCEYPAGEQPQVPFPYFAEVWSGSEYAAAALMIHSGMISEGLQIIESTRRRFDGEKRNPWSEAECGYHYARPMASWAPLLALSGFRYWGVQKTVVAKPLLDAMDFSSFWSAGTAWGNFSHRVKGQKTRFSLSVTEGHLDIQKLTLNARGTAASAAGRIRNRTLAFHTEQAGDEVSFLFEAGVGLNAGDELVMTF